MKRLLAILLLTGFCFAAPVQAEDSALQTLEDAGIAVSLEPPVASAEALLKLPSVYAMPGTFTYWLMHIVEEIQLIFTADPEEKASLLLSFSRNRLAEGYEAVKNGQADSALKALQQYQHDQHDLATSLNNLQDSDVNVKPYLNRLTEQLGIQQALQEYVKENVNDKTTKDEISSLLDISAVQQLAWQRYNQSALLGEKDVRLAPQSSQSATPSAELK